MVEGAWEMVVLSGVGKSRRGKGTRRFTVAKVMRGRRGVEEKTILGEYRQRKRKKNLGFRIVCERGGGERREKEKACVDS